MLVSRFYHGILHTNAFSFFCFFFGLICVKQKVNARDEKELRQRERGLMLVCQRWIVVRLWCFSDSNLGYYRLVCAKLYSCLLPCPNLGVRREIVSGNRETITDLCTPMQF